jgi:hypothetical protein
MPPAVSAWRTTNQNLQGRMRMAAPPTASGTRVKRLHLLVGHLLERLVLEHLGFRRIVASEKEAPNMLVIMV